MLFCKLQCPEGLKHIELEFKFALSSLNVFSRSPLTFSVCRAQKTRSALLQTLNIRTHHLDILCTKPSILFVCVPDPARLEPLLQDLFSRTDFDFTGRFCAHLPKIHSSLINKESIVAFLHQLWKLKCSFGSYRYVEV